MIRYPRICRNCGHSAWGVTAHVTQDWIVDAFGNFEKCTNSCVETTHAPSEDDVWVCSVCGEEYAKDLPQITDEQAKAIERVLYARYQLFWMLSQGKTVEDIFLELKLIQAETDSADLRSIDLNDAFADAGFGGSLWVCFNEFLGAEFLDVDYMHEVCMNDEQWKMYLQALAHEMQKRR